jgi:succinoglycan biosynthesis transport protein ExoP
MTNEQLIKGSASAVVPDFRPNTSLVLPPAAGTFRLERELRLRGIVVRYGRSIAAIFAVCLVLSALATLFMSPSYKAAALIEVLPVNQEFLNSKDIDPNSSGSTIDSYLDTQSRLLKSESVKDRVVARLLPGLVKNEGKAKNSTKTSSAEGDVRKALASLQVKPEGQSSLISIRVSAPSPQLAADVANEVANQHISALREGRLAMANQTGEFLTGQLNTFRTKLRDSENELQAYAKKSGLVFTTDATRESVDGDKLRELQSDLAKAEADRADKESQMDLTNSGPIEALPKVLDDSAIKDAHNRLAELKRQLASLSSLYTPRHYKVLEVQAQIDVVQQEIKSQRGLVVARVKNDYRAAVRRAALQKESYNQQLALVTAQSGKQVGYDILKREVDANRDLYQSMAQKAREATVMAALQSSNIRIVDPAKRPLLPDQPNILVNCGIGFLSAAMFSALFVLLRERGDGSIQGAGQTMRVIRSPELAIIPTARRDARIQLMPTFNTGKWLLSHVFKKFKAEALIEKSKSLLGSWKTTGSVVAECYRTAVTSILLWGRDADTSHKVLAITSAHPGAGKTTSVLNLGLGLVESGRRVLLIDADLRLPRLGELFDLKDAVGLSNILAQKLHPKVASELIRHTSVEGLHVLPSGSLYKNVTELLHLDVLKALIAEVRSKYDFILIDTPPAIPLSDARILAQHADGVILIIKAGVTKVEQTAAVQQFFRQDGISIFGSILNHWNARAEDPDYIKSYKQYSISGQERDVATFTSTKL